MTNFKLMAAAAATTLTVASLSAITAAPAQAAGTAITLTLTGGALEISVPATANLGSVSAVAAGQDFSAQIGQVVVTDNRAAGTGAGWVASAISTALTPTAGPSIAATNIGYTAGTIKATAPKLAPMRWRNSSEASIRLAPPAGLLRASRGPIDWKS